MKKHTSITSHQSPTKLWNTHHDQPEKRRIILVELLNSQLVELIDLGLQAKQAHWNVKGPYFTMLHTLFDEVAHKLGELTDEVAERAVMLGGTTRGTLHAVSLESSLPAYPLEALDGREHLWAMSAALAHFARSSRKAVSTAEKSDDSGTVDLLTQVSRGADELLWKVEAHIALEPDWSKNESDSWRVGLG
ncbi:MAG: DNA starvation/stationary phase protection protein Dps [Verrucomicrobiota bacterium]